MSTKTTIRKILIFSVIAVLLAAFAGFYAGRSIERHCRKFHRLREAPVHAGIRRKTHDHFSRQPRDPLRPGTGGAEMPGVLEDASGEYIFLVDHSEYRQAAPGMEIDGPTAYLLLSAILSDTANLTSSTVTTADREAVAALSKIADVSDIDALYRELYERLLSYDGMSDEEIFFSDYKKYEAYGVTFGIAGVNAIDEAAAAQLAERMQAVLPDIYPQAGMDLLYALISIRSEGKKIDYVVPGNDYSRQVFCEAFPDYDEFNGTAYIYRKGMGRKTVFPGLM